MRFPKSLHPLVLLVVTVCAASCLSAQSKGAEQALRARVEKYYSLVQVAQWEAAEKFVTSDTRANFRAVPKGPLMGYEYESASMEEDGKTATVRVKVQTFAPEMGGALTVTTQTTWKLVSGTWYLYVPKPAASPVGSGISVKTPPPDIKFNSDQLDLGSLTDRDVIERRVGFTNVSGHPVTVQSVASDSALLKLSATKKVLQPQEQAELVVQFNAVGYYGSFAQTVVVKTNPGARVARVNVLATVGPAPKEAKDK
jgi:hypothetical protein